MLAFHSKTSEVHLDKQKKTRSKNCSKFNEYILLYLEVLLHTFNICKKKKKCLQYKKLE